MSESEEEIRKALEEVLALYDIKLDEKDVEPDEEKEDVSDYSEVISKTQTRLDELNEKAENIFKTTGMTEEQLEAYAANPNNFTKEQWDALEKVKAACDGYRNEARAKIGEERLDKTEKQAKKKKKQPGRFAKKKHWIPL